MDKNSRLNLAQTSNAVLAESRTSLKLVFQLLPDKHSTSLAIVGFLVGDGLHNRTLDCLENEWLDTGLLSF